MAADGDAEIEATLARLNTLAGGRIFETALSDDSDVVLSGEVRPHVILDFGATVRTGRDRILAASEPNQPHILPVNAACIAGSAADARKLARGVMGLLLGWSPSADSDPYRAEGGYGAQRVATANTPTRFVRGIFFETTLNNVFPA